MSVATFDPGGCVVWWHMKINDTEVHTLYPPPFGEGAFTQSHMDGSLTSQQLRTQTAVHEAGHAVVGMAVGLKVFRVEVNADPIEFEQDGFKENGRVWAVTKGAPLRETLLLLAAGVRAGHRWLTDNGLLDNVTAFSNDAIHGFVDQASMHTAAANHATSLTWGDSNPEGQVDITGVYRDADILIDHYWMTISRLADHLLAHGA